MTYDGFIGNDGSSLDKFVRNISRELLFNELYQRNEITDEKPRVYYGRDLSELLYEREENIFEANSYQFGNNLGDGITFGVTFVYGGRIFILDSLKGNDRDKVLKHEKHHRSNPSESEYMTREKTSTVDFSPNQDVSSVGCY